MYLKFYQIVEIMIIDRCMYYITLLVFFNIYVLNFDKLKIIPDYNYYNYIIICITNIHILKKR